MSNTKILLWNMPCGIRSICSGWRMFWVEKWRQKSRNCLTENSTNIWKRRRKESEKSNNIYL